MNSMANEVMNNEVMAEAMPGMVNMEVPGIVTTGVHDAPFGRKAPEKTTDAMKFGQDGKKFAVKFGKDLREQLAVTWTKLAKLGHNWRPRASRQLRLCETLPLGERRFLSIVQFEEQKFLIGSAGNSVALLTRLEKHEDAATAPKKHFRKKQIAAVRRRKQKSK